MSLPAAPREPRLRPLGLRWEVRILFPAALLLLMGLSLVTLFAYRDAVAELTEERRQEAARQARRVAEQLSSGMPADAETLRRLAPQALGVALLDAAGVPLAVSGSLPAADLLAPLGGRSLDEPRGFGPDPAEPERVTGFAPLAGTGGRRHVRLDLAAGSLAGPLRSLPRLTVLVLAAGGGVLLLVLLFLRHLLAPWERLLAQARRLGGPEEPGGDETAFLISTFERAADSLAAGAAAPSEAAPEGDIATLERLLSASLESGLLLLDGQGRLLALNPVGAALLDLVPPPAGTPLSEALADRPELLAALRRPVESRRGVRRREVAVEAGGETLTLGLSVHPLRRDDGRVRGFLVLFADLTEARRRDEESRLAESLARLGEISAGVAHELRNGLATLRGYLGLLARRPEAAAGGEELAEMRREMDHLERVADDFLAFARPETARVEEVRLAELAGRAAADPALAAARVRVVDEGGGDARLRGDPPLLERALRNLLHNAAEAGGGEEIVLRLRAGDEGVEGGEGAEVAVEDRGPGLPPEVRRRLFQPFVSGRPGGVGLGLALSHRIAELHGGRLRIEDRPGGGTRAVLVLPASG